MTTEPENHIPHPGQMPAQRLVIETEDVLDRIVELGRDARDIDILQVSLPAPIPGLPDHVTALVKYKPGGAEISSFRELFKPYETAPERRTGTAKVTTLTSFIALTNRHKDAHSAIFAKTDWPGPCLTAVLNYHQTDGTARYRDHKVFYEFPMTDEFKGWMTTNGKSMDQGQFALFVEEHIDELAAPCDAEVLEYKRLFQEGIATPSEMLALSRGLEVHVGAKIKRQERLASGERTVQFETTHTDDKGEPVRIPGVFMICVAAFVDGEPLRMPARLRYRVKGGDITWHYQLYRPETWLRERVLADLLEATTRTDLPAFEGVPE